jgi:hypothetical protein
MAHGLDIRITAEYGRSREARETPARGGLRVRLRFVDQPAAPATAFQRLIGLQRPTEPLQHESACLP